MQQDTFPFIQNTRMSEALKSLNAMRQTPPRLDSFARELASFCLNCPPGTLILAGVPGNLAADCAIQSLQEVFSKEASHQADCKSPQIAFLEIPHATNVRQQQRLLAGTYTGLADGGIGHIHRPQFKLDFDTEFSQVEPLVKISNTIRHRSADIYLVKVLLPFVRGRVRKVSARGTILYNGKVFGVRSRTNPLLPYAGKDVDVRWDEDNLDRIYVFPPKSRMCIPLDNLQCTRVSEDIVQIAKGNDKLRENQLLAEGKASTKSKRVAQFVARVSGFYFASVDYCSHLARCFLHKITGVVWSEC